MHHLQPRALPSPRGRCAPYNNPGYRTRPHSKQPRTTSTTYHQPLAAFQTVHKSRFGAHDGQAPRPGQVRPGWVEAQGPAAQLGGPDLPPDNPHFYIRISLFQSHKSVRRSARHRNSVGCFPTTSTTIPLGQDAPTDKQYLIRWESINIGISVIALLFTAYEILRTMTEGLTPKTLLVTSLVKLFGAVLCMIMDGMVTGTSLDGWSDGILVIHSLLL